MIGIRVESGHKVKAMRDFKDLHLESIDRHMQPVDTKLSLPDNPHMYTKATLADLIKEGLGCRVFGTLEIPQQSGKFTLMTD